MKSLGERIAFLRREKGLSQRKLMEILHFENLSKYEKNQRQPNYDILTRIANYFEVSTDWLLLGETFKYESIPETLVQGNESLTPYTTATKPSSLTDEEIELLSSFRKLNVKDRLYIDGYIKGMLAKANDMNTQKSE